MTSNQSETTDAGGPRAAAGSAAEWRGFEDDSYFEWGDEDEYMVHWRGATDEDYSGRNVYYAEVTGVVHAETGKIMDVDTDMQPTDWWRQHGEAVEEAANKRAASYYDDW